MIKKEIDSFAGSHVSPMSRNSSLPTSMHLTKSGMRLWIFLPTESCRPIFG